MTINEIVVDINRILETSENQYTLWELKNLVSEKIKDFYFTDANGVYIYTNRGDSRIMIFADGTCPKCGELCVDSKNSETNAKLDNKRICDLFAIFTDLPDEELPRWNSLCKSVGEQISSRLNENADILHDMERLCTAAAAVAYCDYSIQQNNNPLDAIAMRDYFLTDIRSLISAEDAAELLELHVGNGNHI